MAVRIRRAVAIPGGRVRRRSAGRWRDPMEFHCGAVGQSAPVLDEHRSANPPVMTTAASGGAARRSDFEIDGAARFLDEQQAQFATALLDPRLPTPPGLVGPDGKPSTKRFNVYRNNVVAGLTATLRDAHPAVTRIVGDEFSVAMARIYLAGAPPRSPIMLHYGAGFPDFIAAFEPVESVPYLRDVARIASDDLPNLGAGRSGCGRQRHPRHSAQRRRRGSLAFAGRR